MHKNGSVEDKVIIVVPDKGKYIGVLEGCPFVLLGVDDFLKKSSVLSFSSAALKRYGQPLMALAEMEGLEAHGRAVSLRLKD